MIKRIFKNTFYLSVGAILSGLIGMFTTAYYARILSSVNFGNLNFIIAVMSYFAVLAVFGTEEIAIRDISSSESYGKNKYFEKMIGTRIMLSVTIFILLVLMVIVINKFGENRLLFVIYGLSLFYPAFMIKWYFEAIERMEFIGISNIISKILCLILVILLIKNPNDIVKVISIEVVVLFLQASILILIYIMRYGLIKISFDFTFSLNLIKQSSPLMVTNFLEMVILFAPILFLRFLINNEAVGTFSAAYKIPLYAIVLGASFLDAVFPTIAKYHKIHKQIFNKIFIFVFWISILCGVFVSAICSLFAKQIILSIYGYKYYSSVFIFKVISWFILLNFLNCFFRKVLIASGNQKKYLLLIIFIGIMATILNYLGIYFYKLNGAVMSVVLVQLLSIPMYLWALRGIIKWSYPGKLDTAINWTKF